MDIQSRANCKHVILDSDPTYEVDDQLPLCEQVTQFQVKMAIQKKVDC